MHTFRGKLSFSENVGFSLRTSLPDLSFDYLCYVCTNNTDNNTNKEQYGVQVLVRVHFGTKFKISKSAYGARYGSNLVSPMRGTPTFGY